MLKNGHTVIQIKIPTYIQERRNQPRFLASWSLGRCPSCERQIRFPLQNVSQFKCPDCHISMEPEQSPGMSVDDAVELARVCIAHLAYGNPPREFLPPQGILDMVFLLLSELLDDGVSCNGGEPCED